MCNSENPGAIRVTSMDILVLKHVLQLAGQVVVNSSASGQGRGRRVRVHVFVRVGISGKKRNQNK